MTISSQNHHSHVKMVYTFYPAAVSHVWKWILKFDTYNINILFKKYPLKCNLFTRVFVTLKQNNPDVVFRSVFTLRAIKINTHFNHCNFEIKNIYCDGTNWLHNRSHGCEVFLTFRLLKYALYIQAHTLTPSKCIYISDVVDKYKYFSFVLV